AEADGVVVDAFGDAGDHHGPAGVAPFVEVVDLEGHHRAAGDEVERGAESGFEDDAVAVELVAQRQHDRERARRAGHPADRGGGQQPPALRPVQYLEAVPVDLHGPMIGLRAPAAPEAKVTCRAANRVWPSRPGRDLGPCDPGLSPLLWWEQPPSATRGTPSAASRTSPPPAPRGEHPDDVAGVQGDRALVREALGPAFIATAQHPVLTGGARLTALESPGPAHAPLGDQADGAVPEGLQVALDPFAARGQAFAPTAPPQPVAQDPQGERPLEGLRGRIAGVRHPGVDAALAGAGGAGALAAGDRLVVDPARPADEEVVHRALAGGGHPVGGGPGQGAEADVGHAL